MHDGRDAVGVGVLLFERHVSSLKSFLGKLFDGPQRGEGGCGG